MAGQGWLGLRGPRLLERWPTAEVGFESWRPLASGVDYANARLSHPRPLRCHAVRIDLQNPSVELVVNSNADGPTGWISAQFPSSLLRKLGAVAAINATPFSPEAVLPGTRVKLDGLARSGGREWAPKLNNLDALIQRTNGQIAFLQGGETVLDARLGVGGFLMTLKDGTNVGESVPQDASTTVGVSADGRWMYWLIIDGGQQGYSEGATPRETAEIQRRLGAHNVLNLDGGSSSTLVTATGWCGAEVRNRPRHPAYSGLQRPVATVLAVRFRRTEQ